jgi:S1-C subfamily serine protease
MSTPKTIAATALVTALMGCGAATVASNSGAGPVDPPGPQPLSDKQIVQQMGPAVVRLTGETTYGGVVSGSGVVIDAKKGLVLTNAHVVAGTTALRANVAGRDAGPARIEGQAPCEDLAVVRLDVPPAGLKAAKLGSSGKVETLDHVLALGYPMSPEAEPSLSATPGSVSKAHMQANPDGAVAGSLPEYRSVIQHDAVIRPGNSGGPLFNRFGEVVGINSLGDNGGQSWAISSDHARAFISGLAAGRNRAYVGWSAMPVQEFLAMVEDPAPFAALSAAESGLVLTGVESNSPAYAARFEPGNYVETFNGTPVGNVADVCQIVQSQKPGAVLPVHAYELGTNDWGLPEWFETPAQLKLQ